MRPSSRGSMLAGLAVGLAIVATACSSAAATPVPTAAGAASAGQAAATLTIGVTNDPTLGGYLTGLNGMTLYVLTTDSADTSTCTADCATNWPPLTVASGATITGPSGATGTFGTFARADGSMQVSYNHMPLYYYAGDSAPGDHNGEGKNNTWFVAPLSGSLSSAAPAAATPAPTAVPSTNSGY